MKPLLLSPTLIMGLTLISSANAATTPATAATQQQQQVQQQTYPYYLEPGLNNFCQPMNIQLCGSNYVTGSAQLGENLSIKLPSLFVADSANIQCVFQNGVFVFKPTESPATLCVRKTCKPGYAQICGIQIPIPVESQAGDPVDLSQAPGLLATNVPPTSVIAQCDVVNGKTLYDFPDPDTLSCNIFACQPVQLNACDQTITIVSPANLGAVIQVATETHQQVTVQCLGSQALAPQYKVIDQHCY